MSASAPQPTLGQDIVTTLRWWLRGRRGPIAAIVALAVPALWFGWPWLVAAGIAPLLLAIAPCAVMCGLGLCMSKACAKPGAAAGTPPVAGSDARPLQRAATAAADGSAETEAPPARLPPPTTSGD